MDELVRALVEIQERRGMTGRQMAAELGIDPSTWCRIRNGSRGIGHVTLQRVFARFPELGPVWLATVSAGPSSSTEAGDGE